MSQPSLDAMQRCCRVLAGRACDDWSDRELLERFANQRDEIAFAVLLDRHGPVVRGVCRRVLRDEHRADDVFQAVFLVLAQKAGSLRRGDLVANWLFGVARRLALQARRQHARREAHEQKAATERSETTPAPPAWDELLAVLEEELQRLPSRLRAPLLACYHRGRTQDEAAKEFGWHVRTLRRRLARGRELLRERLERRGATLTAGLFAAALSPAVADATLPAALRNATLLAVLGGPATDSVNALVRGGLHMLTVAKVQKWTSRALLVAVALTAGGLGWRGATLDLGAKPAEPPAVATAEAPAKAAVETNNGGDPRPPLAEEPLPEGAVIRLGTLRLRHGGTLLSNPLLVFADDDKTLLSGGDGYLREWRVADGVEKHAVGPEPKLKLVPLAALTSADAKTAFQVVGDLKQLRLQVFETGGWRKLREVELTPHPLRLDQTEIDYRGIGSWSTKFIVTPDGTRVANITPSGRVVLWDTTTGKHAQTLQLPRGRIHLAAFTPDNASLVTVDEAGPFHLWDLKTGKEGGVFYQSGGAPEMLSISADTPLAVSPDGKTLALGTQGTRGPGFGGPAREPRIRLLPLKEGGVWADLYPIPERGEDEPGPTFPGSADWSSETERVHRLVFAADGKSLFYSASGSRSEWGRVTISSGKDAAAPPGAPSQPEAVAKVALRIASGFGYTPDWLAISRDGKTLATGSSDGVIRQWDADTGKERPAPAGHRSGLAALAWQSDSTVVTIGHDGTIHSWEIGDGKLKETVSVAKTILPKLALSPNGRWLVSWRSAESRTLRGQPRSRGPRGNGDATAQIYDAGSDEVRYRLNIPASWDFVFGPTGDTIITMQNDGTLKEWDLKTGKKIRVGPQVASGHHRLIGNNVVVTIDNVCLGVEFANGKELFRWSLQKEVFQETLGQTNPERVLDAAISPDAKTIALAIWNPTAGTSRVVLCDLKTGKIQHELDLGKSMPAALAFAPDGKTLVTASDQVRVWDPGTGKLKRTLGGHRGKIEALAFNKDGTRLATASADSTVLVWDMGK